MDYEQELALKQAHVQSCLTRIGGQTISALLITGAAQTDGYRNKVQFPVQEQDGRPVAGFFSGKTHRVIPVRHCRIQPDCADAIRGAVLSWMEQYHIRAYDEQTHTGYIRHIYIRFGAESGQILVCIVANCAQLPKKKQLVAALLAAEPGITTIVFSPNTKRVIPSSARNSIRFMAMGPSPIRSAGCSSACPPRRFIRSTTRRRSGCTKRPCSWLV